MIDVGYLDSEAQENALDVPPHLEGVVFEFMRLTDEASDYLVSGRLLPCLSTLTGLLPLVGFIRDFCVSQVIPSLNEGGSAGRHPEDLAGASGLYL